jgi:DNA-binding FadR family transcriptional regulator
MMSGKAARQGRSADRVIRVVRSQWLSGSIAPGGRLPSVCQAARQLGVHPTTVGAAYQRLADDGLLLLKPGSGTYATGRQMTGELLCLAGAGMPSGHMATVMHLLAVDETIQGMGITCRMLSRERETVMAAARQAVDGGRVRGVWIGNMRASCKTPQGVLRRLVERLNHSRTFMPCQAPPHNCSDSATG